MGLPELLAVRVIEGVQRAVEDVVAAADRWFRSSPSGKVLIIVPCSNTAAGLAPVERTFNKKMQPRPPFFLPLRRPTAAGGRVPNQRNTLNAHLLLHRDTAEGRPEGNPGGGMTPFPDRL